MAPPADRPALDPLVLRIATALCLGVGVVAALWAGFPYFDLVVVLFAAVLAWEWRGLCSGGRFGVAGVVLAAFCMAVAGATAVGRLDAAAVLLGAGVLVVAGLSLRETPLIAAWLVAGMIYIGVACAALIWLRRDSALGVPGLLWFLAVIWATDTAAFLVGRTLGGPKLAPVVSPNKTWSGALGGLVGALAVTGAALTMGGIAHPGALASVAILLSITGQVGDLVESAIKRHFGVKDSSRIIPGHGGALDRVDSLLLATPIAAGLVLLQQAGYWEWK